MRRPSPGVVRRQQSINKKKESILSNDISSTTIQKDSQQQQLQSSGSSFIIQGQGQNMTQSNFSGFYKEEEEQKSESQTYLTEQQSQQNQQEYSELQSTQVEEDSQHGGYPVFDTKRITNSYQTSLDYNNTILTVKYSNDDQNIAIGQQDGSIKIFNNRKQTPSYTLKDIEIPSACTVLRWNPAGALANSLVAGYSNGYVLYWHSSSQKILYRYEEKENPINALDISPDGIKFATGGQDGQIRVYDVGKKTQPTIFEQSDWAPTHTNRVYGIKFEQNNPNLFISGGWDNMILTWDLRMKSTTGYIYGPKIFSDSFDIQGNTLLTGSWREKNQLELFDLRKRKKLCTIPWQNYTPEDQNVDSLVYCCQFSKSNPDQIIAGSTGTYELRLFEKSSELSNNYQCVDIFQENLEKGVYCVDFAKSFNDAAYGCGDGQFGTIKCE